MTIYPELERQLIEIAGRRAAGPARRRAAAPTRRRRRPRLGAVVVTASSVAALLIAGFALTLRASPPSRGGAGAVTFGNPSEPLTGVVAGRPGSGGNVGQRYSIVVTPSLSAGTAGWSSWISFAARNGTFEGGGGGGGGYPSAAAPLFASDGNGTFAPGTRTTGNTVAYVLTGPEVYGVRIGGQTVRTSVSPVLPAGDRAAVLFRPANAPPLVTELGLNGRTITFAAPGSSAPAAGNQVRGLRLIPLDRRGRPIATTGSAFVRVSGTFWQSPKAVTPGNRSAPFRGRTTPAPGVCELADSAPARVVPAWGTTIRAITRVPDSLGELFFSCVSTEYYVGGWPLAAAVLLDARHPGARLDAIPGASAVLGEPNIVDYTAGHLSARRVGNAWLVVKGASLTVRAQALRALSVSKLDLRPAGAP